MYSEQYLDTLSYFKNQQNWNTYEILKMNIPTIKRNLN